MTQPDNFRRQTMKHRRIWGNVMMFIVLSLLLQWQGTQVAWSNQDPGDPSARLELSKEVRPGDLNDNNNGNNNENGETVGTSANDTLLPPIDTLVTYTIWLRNVSDGNQRVPVHLKDLLPPGVVFTGDVRVVAESGKANPLKVQFRENRLVWRGTLSPGAVLRIEYTAWVQQCPAAGSDREFTNTVYAQRPGGELIQASASFTQQCPPDGNGEPAGIDVALHKSGELQHNFNPETGEVETQIVWTLTYANRGDTPAGDVVIIDRLAGLNINDYVLDVLLPDGVSAEHQDDTVIFNVSEITPGIRSEITIITSIPPIADTDNPVVTNEAVAQVDNDVNLDNNTAEASVRITARAPEIISPIDGATCQNEIEVQGKAQPYAEVTLFVNDEENQVVQADEDGRWHVTIELADGIHTLHAESQLGPIASPPSQPVQIHVDSTLLWDPMSFTFTGPDGAIHRAVDADGAAVIDGWRIGLRPNTTYTVSVFICCDDEDNGAEVSLHVTGTAPITLTGEGTGVYTGEYTTPEVTEDTQLDVQLVVRCGDEEVTSEGELNIFIPRGMVIDRVTGEPVADATLVLLSVQQDSQQSQAILTPWDAEPYGQQNPQTTGDTGAYYFAPPPGEYQLLVFRVGYQVFRTPIIQVSDEPIQREIALTPVYDRPADHVLSLGNLKAELAMLKVRPGAIVKWLNDGGSERLLIIVRGAGATLNPAGITDAAQADQWESGVLNPGESYELMLDTVGAYQVFDALDPDSIYEIEVTEEPAQTEEPALFVPFILN